MIIKFLARGTGSAAAAADYLTREQNLAPEQDQDQDQDREQEKNPEEVKVLRGNPHQVADVADALEFEHKYTSGVIAWAPKDKPSDAQIGRVVDEFEKTAWAGLEPDRYAWAAVQHREAGGGVHVHVLAARCDLETGKSLNIAAPGWQKTFDTHCGTGRTTRTAGAVRTIRSGRGTCNPAIGPTSRPPSFGRGWRRRKIPGG